ncbi:MAG: MHS family MFS transporter [Pseudomonadales bacterium]|nr:MHS family MFS transporter [Pseudomonadales bacterium]
MGRFSTDDINQKTGLVGSWLWTGCVESDLKTRILWSSLMGTTIEFYDFYIYGTASALVLGPAFFPGQSATGQTLSALATFALAFVARPVGAAIFGHWGDRFGRKSTWIATLMLTGISTTCIGFLPDYSRWGIMAPLLLCLLRLGQGLGLGGEWGGAALVCTEHAPDHRRAWYGMFPQLGAPFGFILTNAAFYGVTRYFSAQDFLTWGWRLPFVASAILLAIGLGMRVTLAETPQFMKANTKENTQRVPLVLLMREHRRSVLIGSLSMVSCYALFYISTVFCLGYGSHILHIPQSRMLALECTAVVFMAIAIPISAWLADRVGRRPVVIIASLLTLPCGLAMSLMLQPGHSGILLTWLSMALGLMGALYGPMGAVLTELFPLSVRYSGTALAYNLAGILGASLAPYLATWLSIHVGLLGIGLYIVAAGLVSMLAFLVMQEGRGMSWSVES